jgi:apolipoprotein N-acyltransferase
VALLLANEALAAAVARRREGVRSVARPLAVAALVPLLLAAYGLAALAVRPTPAGKPLRMGLVQSNIVDYERLRRERGAAAVVREVLDVHYAMTYDAVERQHARAVLWSEPSTPRPSATPRAKPAPSSTARSSASSTQPACRSCSGPTTVTPRVSTTRPPSSPRAPVCSASPQDTPVPLTEHVPPWLDGPTLRRWLPWSGTWRPGTGARVFPLKLADGREIPVLPLICLDDMDTDLAIEGARLGAQAIVTMSNDSWFSDGPQGAQLHLAAAAFRSIETRLPQFRATSNGINSGPDQCLDSPISPDRAVDCATLTRRMPSKTFSTARCAAGPCSSPSAARDRD